MKIIVTGATGHIGSYLIRDLGLQFKESEIVMIDNMMTQRFASLFKLPKIGNYSFIDGYKVFKSINGGQSWINLSTPILDGDKPTNIEHQRGSDGGVYLGTRNSVYYRNNRIFLGSIRPITILPQPLSGSFALDLLYVV